MTIGYTPSRITLSQPIKWATGVAIAAAAYQIGRNADGTNLLQLNVPTGASFEFSINDVAQMTLSATTLTIVPTTIALGATPSITTVSGNLSLNPSGSVTFNNKSLLNIASIRGSASSSLNIGPNLSATDTAAQRLILDTIDTVGDARVVAAYAVPTATETTPFFAMRANGTIPIAGTLDANFCAIRWNEPTDAVTLYVNDGGTIRSLALGIVT